MAIRQKLFKAAGIVTLCAGMSGLLATCTNPATNTSNKNAEAGPAGSVEVPPLPPGFPTPVISGNVPVSVRLPSSVQSSEQARPFFDYFSWESFIALNWPAESGERGVPTQPGNPTAFLSAGQGYPVVWGTYRDALDLYDSGNQRPPAWNSPDSNPLVCKGTAQGMKVFEMVAKGSTFVDDINEAFSFPLIDQFKNYALFEMRFNQTQYDFIRGADDDPATWRYLLKNIVQPLQMPAGGPPNIEGSTMLKAAWREMTPQDQQNRYYVVTAQVYDPISKTCSPKQMGLVGFHIVRKLKDFPEWIWSTFEQVDNVHRVPGATPQTPISFNNGTNDPPTKRGWANRPAAKSPNLQPRDERVPVQVTRLNPIPITPAGASTVDLNAIYQRMLQGTVWQYYQLVFTQWPTNPGSFTLMESGGIYPQGSGSPFPVSGVTNTTMETYFQAAYDASGAGGNSCMSCHYRADSTDFSWSLKRRAHN